MIMSMLMRMKLMLVCRGNLNQFSLSWIIVKLIYNVERWRCIDIMENMREHMERLEATIMACVYIRTHTSVYIAQRFSGLLF